MTRLPWLHRTAVLAMAAFALPAAAQSDLPKFELTPFAAYRFGGELDGQSTNTDFDVREGDAQGLLFDIRAKDVNTQWEMLYARQSTELTTQPTFGAPLLDLDVDYLHFGGTYLFDGNEVRPFIALTAGVTRFEPAPSQLDAENYFSASIGGGVHLRADKRVGVRLEGRVFASLINDDGALFCASGAAANACAIVIDGETLFQWEMKAGAVLRF
jgi:hypothetical protein